MNFNFYDQYRAYSNIELLRIVMCAEEYRTEAVEAARLLLKDRDVRDEEVAEVEKLLADKKKRAERIAAYKDKAKDFLQPVVQPASDLSPGKWLKILLLLVVLDYLWVLYDAASGLVSYFRCDYCEFDLLFFLISLLGIVYIPFIFFLLLKRKRWGWILLFADNGIAVLSRLSQMHMFFKYQNMHGVDTAAFLIAIFIKTGFLIFLWRKEISDYFGVSFKAKQYSLIFLGIIAAIALTGLFLNLYA